MTTIRSLQPDDRAAWDPLWTAYLAFYRSELDVATTDSTFARLCEVDGELIGMLAVDASGQATGFAHLIFHPSTWSRSGYCYLEDLFVDPTVRGTGTAQQLIEASYAVARERGSEKVYWHTQQFNGRARSLYDTVAQPTSFVVYEHEL
jgi:GNAT superfamily N-acetyltransferase